MYKCMHALGTQKRHTHTFQKAHQKVYVHKKMFFHKRKEFFLINSRVRFKHLLGEAGTTPTGRLRLRVVDDSKGAAYHLLYKIDGTTLNKIQGSLIYYYLCAIGLV